AAALRQRDRGEEKQGEDRAHWGRGKREAGSGGDEGLGGWGDPDCVGCQTTSRSRSKITYDANAPLANGVPPNPAPLPPSSRFPLPYFLVQITSTPHRGSFL